MVQETCICRTEIGRNSLTKLGPNQARLEKSGPTYNSGPLLRVSHLVCLKADESL